jgi:pSer/pThr/pTyr-binding forkhead associated (FHA) protein
MSAQVTLTVTDLRSQKNRYRFTEHTWCVVGRGDDCDIQLPHDGLHADVSRHHCLFEIDPPSVRVRDLGSRNGTYVNEDLIGQRPRDCPPEEVDSQPSPMHELKHGDEIRVGHVNVQVEVSVATDVLQPMYFS